MSYLFSFSNWFECFDSRAAPSPYAPAPVAMPTTGWTTAPPIPKIRANFILSFLKKPYLAEVSVMIWFPVAIV